MNEKQPFQLDDQTVRDLEDTELDAVSGAAGDGVTAVRPSTFYPPGGVPFVSLPDLGAWGFR